MREFTEGNYYLGGAVNPRNADMVARDEGDKLVFNGDKFFSTGRFAGRPSPNPNNTSAIRLLTFLGVKVV